MLSSKATSGVCQMPPQEVVLISDERPSEATAKNDGDNASDCIHDDAKQPKGSTAACRSHACRNTSVITDDDDGGDLLGC